MARAQLYIIISLLSLFWSLSATVTVAEQQNLWVTSKNASLKAEMKASSATITTLPKGTKLTILTQEGRWYQVSTPSNKSGWIYRGKVSTTKPADSGSGGLFGSLSGSSDIELNSADTSRSVRGLSPEAEIYAKNTKTPATYKKALDKVMAIKTSDAQIENFLKTGHIGEYAR